MNSKSKSKKRLVKTKFLKGINYGKYTITEENIELDYGEQNIFRLPLNEIANSTVYQKQKTEVNIEMDLEDKPKNHDNLESIRFYIPYEKGLDVQLLETPAMILNDEIRQKSEIGQNAGKMIVSLPKLSCLVPRGKYLIQMYSKSMQMTGDSQQFSIKYKHIWKAYLLPQQQRNMMYFVIGLSKPLKKGMTQYYFVLIEMKSDWKQEIKVLLDEEEREKIAEGKLKESYSSSVSNTLARLFKYIVGIQTTIPGDAFKSSKGYESIQCTVKASQGFLYPLTKSLFYVYKPLHYINHDDIAKVNFYRTQTKSRYIEFTIYKKGSGQKFNFMGIDATEATPLERYFTEKGIRVHHIDEEGNEIDVNKIQKEMNQMYDENEEDDESFKADDEDEDEDDESFKGDDEEDDDKYDDQDFK